MLDNRQPVGERIDPQKRPLQPDVRQALSDSSKDSFMKLMKTAYAMAVVPSMPHKHFSVLVKCQRDNGVRLVEGKDTSDAAREFVHCIAEAVVETCASIISKSPFVSILSDGSQARKTKDEKELVLLRTVRNGKPVYLVVALLDMKRFCGVNAMSIKTAIDSIFSSEDGKTHRICINDYIKNVVSATADGANVNLGVYSGVLTQMKHEREWLVNIHCVNHRLELALKDVIKSFVPFQRLDSFYKDLWYLLRKSGKLKAEIMEAAAALDITFYEFPKIHGTRFLSHRKRGMTRLLHNWPAVKLAFENVVASNKGCAGETKAKVGGLLKKLKDYRHLCSVAAYLDVLDSLGPLSLVFEKQNLLAFEIPPAVERTKDSLKEIAEEHSLVASHLGKYRLERNGDKMTVKVSFPKAGHERRKPDNRDHADFEIEGLANAQSETIQATLEMLKEAGRLLIPVIEERFNSFDQDLFGNMIWLDPKYWDNASKEYGVEQIKFVADLFTVPLQEASFDCESVIKEWKSLKYLQRSLYPTMEAGQFWEKILNFRHAEFPNLCLLVSLCFCVSGSNSSVERAFSILTIILSDKRLRMSHKTMEECIIIAGNDTNWDKSDREKILSKAVEIYMGKRRTAVFPKKSISEKETDWQSSNQNVDILDVQTSSSKDTSDSDDSIF